MVFSQRSSRSSPVLLEPLYLFNSSDWCLEITVGGAYAGTAGESSSFKYGLFDSIISSVELVLADGTVTTASESENKDLLYGSAGACGTTGVITLLEVELIDSTPFVELEYHHVSSMSEASKIINDGFSNPSGLDFLDGILFSPDSGVMMLGNLTNSADSSLPIRRFTRARDQHFYRHAEKLLAYQTHRFPLKEIVPIVDYLFRYNRGCFWGAKFAFEYFKVPFNRVTRFFLDPFMQASVMFHALHESGLANQGMIQDVSFPLESTAAFVDYVCEEFDSYPLWLCPLRPTSFEKINTAGRSFGIGRKAAIDSRFCNVGVWCMVPKMSEAAFVRLNRDFERKVHELDGIKALYAHTYYAEDEFWDVYDKEAYEKLRWKYNANTLPTVFDKVKVKPRQIVQTDFAKQRLPERLIATLRAMLWDIWPFSGLYGVWRTIVARDYLLRSKTD